MDAGDGHQLLWPGQNGLLFTKALDFLPWQRGLLSQDFLPYKWPHGQFCIVTEKGRVFSAFSFPFCWLDGHEVICSTSHLLKMAQTQKRRNLCPCIVSKRAI
jgi:hypothetical protein